MDQPLVSVVMPVYNGLPFLSEAVESVRSQTMADWELIAVDDGSTDGSREVLQAAAVEDDRVVPINLDRNQGHDVASNTALDAARGRYIARQDQDDVWLPDRLALGVQALESDASLGLVTSSYYRWTTDGQRHRRDAPTTHAALRSRLAFGNPICHAAVTLRAELRDTGELRYRRLPGPQDYDLWIRLLSVTKGGSIREPLVLYRMHEHTMSALFADEQPDAVRAISDAELKRLVPSLGDWDDLDAVRSARHVRLESEAARRAIPAVLEVYHALAREPNVDRSELADDRRAWILRAHTALLRRRRAPDVRALASLARADPASPVAWVRAKSRRRLRQDG